MIGEAPYSGVPHPPTPAAALTLYDNDLSTCAQKVRVAMAEKDLSYQRHSLDLRAREQHTPEYLRLNPKGVVPTLVDGDTVVVESTVILEYLEDAFPEVSMRPSSPAERAKMRGWLKLLDDRFHLMTAIVSFSIAFHRDFRERSEAAREAWITAGPDEATRSRRRGMIEQGINYPELPIALNAFDRAFGDFEQTLSRSAWLAGESFSLADAAWMPYFNRLEHLGLCWLWEDRSAVAQWWQLAQGKPSYDAAILSIEDPAKVARMRDAGREHGKALQALYRG